MKTKTKKGFTIVELLIVIVVIGILAAIVILAYQGIRQRAITAKYSATVDQWEKLINLEYAQYGTLPVNGADAWTCVGNSATNFSANSSFPAGVCADVSDDGVGASWRISYDTTYMSQFNTKASFPNGSVGESNRFRLAHGTATTRSIMLNITQDTTGYVISLLWYPPDVSTCGRGADQWAANPYTTSAGCRSQFRLGG